MTTIIVAMWLCCIWCKQWVQIRVDGWQLTPAPGQDGCLVTHLLDLVSSLPIFTFSVIILTILTSRIPVQSTTSGIILNSLSVSELSYIWTQIWYINQSNHMNKYFRQDAAIHNEITHIYAYFCIQSIYHLIFLVALSYNIWSEWQKCNIYWK